MGEVIGIVLFFLLIFVSIPLLFITIELSRSRRLDRLYKEWEDRQSEIEDIFHQNRDVFDSLIFHTGNHILDGSVSLSIDENICFCVRENFSRESFVEVKEQILDRIEQERCK